VKRGKGRGGIRRAPNIEKTSNNFRGQLSSFTANIRYNKR
jgi:hypothetical protein